MQRDILVNIVRYKVNRLILDITNLYRLQIISIFFVDNNGYNILEGWCNHQTEPVLQNALEVAAEETHSLNICPYGSSNIDLKF